jgi:hypothetical protein
VSAGDFKSGIDVKSGGPVARSTPRVTLEIAHWIANAATSVPIGPPPLLHPLFRPQLALLSGRKVRQKQVAEQLTCWSLVETLFFSTSITFTLAPAESRLLIAQQRDYTRR